MVRCVPWLRTIAIAMALSSPAWATTAFPVSFILAIVLIPILPALLAGAVGALLPEPRYGWSLLAGVLLSCAVWIAMSVGAKADDVVPGVLLCGILAFVAHLVAYYSCTVISTVIHNVRAKRRQEQRMAREKNL